MKTFILNLTTPLALVLIVFLISSRDASAQDITKIPMNMPAQKIPEFSGSKPYQPPKRVSNRSRQKSLKPLKPSSRKSQAFPPHPAEKLSEVERFVSEKVVEITETQLEIFMRLGGITFAYTEKNLPPDKIAIPVKIIGAPPPGVEDKKEKSGKETDKEKIYARPVTVDAGYLIGASDVLSNVFKVFGIKSSLIVSTDIRQFGYDFFNLPPSTFAPVDIVPVGPDYVLGPGDELRISLWGDIKDVWNIRINEYGEIDIPTLGNIAVAGFSIKELKEFLHEEFSKYYKNDIRVNVRTGELRTNTIYVVGNAKRPGAYTISSLSTLINALFISGGPTKNGTMRDIQVKRNGKTIVNFDMYDFLLKGDKTKDIRLMTGDVIFIPPIGSVASIAGSVNNPAIYELKYEKRISQLIYLAGGVNTIAFKGRVRIERIDDNSRQTVFESDLDEVENGDIALQSGDIVKIFQIVQDKKIVRIAGAVHREGYYGLKSGMTIKDLIIMSGGLQYYAYREKAELTRVYLTDSGNHTEKVTINLKKAMEGDPDNNITLKENDYIFVRNVPEWQIYRTVTISGEVKHPGTYTITKGERLSSLIERAGGFTGNAYLKGAVFIKERARELQQQHLDDMIVRLERELAEKSAVEQVTLLSQEGAIAGGEITQRRELLNILTSIRAKGRVVLALSEPELLKKTPFDLELEDGDKLFIPSNPQTVQVIGSVFNQTAFAYSREKSFSDYISLAGGYTENADKERIYILKADGTAVKPQAGSDKKRIFKADVTKDLEPGDTIVVPQKLEKIVWVKNIMDFTQILYQMAITAAVVIVLL